jgi:hypothetical protein
MTEVMFKVAFLSAAFTRLSPFLSKGFGGKALQGIVDPSNVLFTGLFSLGGTGVPHPASKTITLV